MLLAELKGYLKITWNDEDHDLLKLIERGKAYLNEISGTELNFEVEGSSKTLLLDYCRYSYNNVIEHFEENFKSQLVRLQIQSAVKSYEKTKV